MYVLRLVLAVILMAGLSNIAIAGDATTQLRQGDYSEHTDPNGVRIIKARLPEGAATIRLIPRLAWREPGTGTLEEETANAILAVMMSGGEAGGKLIVHDRSDGVRVIGYVTGKLQISDATLNEL